MSWCGRAVLVGIKWTSALFYTCHRISSADQKVVRSSRSCAETGVVFGTDVSSAVSMAVGIPFGLICRSVIIENFDNNKCIKLQELE